MYDCMIIYSIQEQCSNKPKYKQKTKTIATHTLEHTDTHTHKNEDLTMTVSKINKQHVQSCLTNILHRLFIDGCCFFFVARIGPRSFSKVGICLRRTSKVSRFFGKRSWTCVFCLTRLLGRIKATLHYEYKHVTYICNIYVIYIYTLYI